MKRLRLIVLALFVFLVALLFGSLLYVQAVPLQAPRVTGFSDSTIIPCLPVGPTFNRYSTTPNVITDIVKLDWTGTPTAAQLIAYVFDANEVHSISVNGQVIGNSIFNPPHTSAPKCRVGSEQAKVVIDFNPAILVKGENTVRIETGSDDWGLARVKIRVSGPDVNGPRHEELAIPSNSPSTYADGITPYEGQGTLTHVQIPSAYDGQTPRCMVVALHEWGERRNAPILEYGAAAEAKGWFLVSPEMHGDYPSNRTGYYSAGGNLVIGYDSTIDPYLDPGHHTFGARSAQQDVIDAVNYMIANFQIDTRCIYLYGRGIGAQTAMLTAAKWPHYFAALIEEEGPFNLVNWDSDLTPGKSPSPMNPNPTLRLQLIGEVNGDHPHKFCEMLFRSPEEYSQNLSQIPFRIVHPISNTVIHIYNAEELYLNPLAWNPSAVITKTLLPGNHGTRPPDYANDYFNWFAQFRRPERVTFFRGKRDSSGPLHWLNIYQYGSNHWTNVHYAGYDPLTGVITTTVIEGEANAADGRYQICPPPAGTSVAIGYNLAQMGLPTDRTYVVEDFNQDSGQFSTYTVAPINGFLTVTIQSAGYLTETAGSPPWPAGHRTAHSFTIYPGDAPPTVITRELRAVADTYLDYYNPTVNRDGASYLRVSNVVGTEKAPGPVHSALIKFDLSSIPANAYIRSASLILFSGQTWGELGKLQVDVHRLARPFEETAATWMMATGSQSWGLPGAMHTVLDYVPAYYDRRMLYQHDLPWAEDFSPNYYQVPYFGFDVTAAVRHWLANPSQNYGFLVRADRQHSSLLQADLYRFFYFVKRNDPTKGPRLVIAYSTSAPTPLPTFTPTPTPGPTGTPTPTPTPTATVTPTPTPTSALARVEGMVYDDQNGNGQYDPGEPPLAGATLALWQGTVLITSTVTGPDGRYSFPDLPPGAYLLRFTPPLGYTLSGGQDQMYIFLGGGQAAVINFFAQAHTPTPTPTPSPTITFRRHYVPIVVREAP